MFKIYLSTDQLRRELVWLAFVVNFVLRTSVCTFADTERPSLDVFCDFCISEKSSDDALRT